MSLYSRRDEPAEALSPVEEGAELEHDPQALPEPGPPEAEVILERAAGRRKGVEVPDVQAMGAEAAVALARACGLRPAPEWEETASERFHGQVLGQEPAPGALTQRGDLLRLVIGTPAVVRSGGLPITDATTTQAVPSASDAELARDTYWNRSPRIERPR